MQHSEITKIPSMSKKDEFIHIRADEELHAALEESAKRCDRKRADHARYILRMALGLSNEGMEREHLEGNLKKLTQVSGTSKPKRGGSHR